MNDQRRRGLRSNAGLIGLMIAALAYGFIESLVAAAVYWDGALGVVLGLFICAQPAANLIDSLYRARSTAGDEPGWLSPLLNGLTMLAGIIVIILGTVQLTRASRVR
jgi:MFS superfamily sulfate permease-like transporter